MAYRIEQTGVELQGILNDAAVTKQRLEDEVARAQAAEGQVWDTLNDEILTRQSQDAALQGNIEREAGLREAGDGQLQGEIYAISEKIPAEASEMNQLADKQYVQEAIGETPTREEVAAIEAVIPAAASEDNELVDTATFEAAIDGKQDTLTFDEEPTEGSENPVTSGGVASAVATLQGLYAELRDGKADKATTLAGYGIEDAYTKDAVDEMIGALSRNEIVVGALPQTGEEGVIYRVPGNGYYTDYMYYDGEFVELSQYSMEFDQTQVGYFTCDTAAGTAAKTVSAAGYTLAVGGSMHIKMTNANTADNVTLNINGAGAKALYYNGELASADNSWVDGEVLTVYYDGTQYQCASGGGGRFATGQSVKDVAIDNTVEEGSNALPTSGAVDNAIKSLSLADVSGAEAASVYELALGVGPDRNFDLSNHIIGSEAYGAWSDDNRRILFMVGSVRTGRTVHIKTYSGYRFVITAYNVVVSAKADITTSHFVEQYENVWVTEDTYTVPNGVASLVIKVSKTNNGDIRNDNPNTMIETATINDNNQVIASLPIGSATAQKAGMMGASQYNTLQQHSHIIGTDAVITDISTYEHQFAKSTVNNDRLWYFIPCSHAVSVSVSTLSSNYQWTVNAFESVANAKTTTNPLDGGSYAWTSSGTTYTLSYSAMACLRLNFRRANGAAMSATDISTILSSLSITINDIGSDGLIQRVERMESDINGILAKDVIDLKTLYMCDITGTGIDTSMARLGQIIRISPNSVIELQNLSSSTIYGLLAIGTDSMLYDWNSRIFLQNWTYNDISIDNSIYHGTIVFVFFKWSNGTSPITNDDVAANFSLTISEQESLSYESPLNAKIGARAVAHRGIHVNDIPEESLSAWRMAARCRMDSAEADVNITSDGKFVMSHDGSLSPTLVENADGTQLSSSVSIIGTTYSDIRTNYRLKSNNPIYREPVPSLEEYLDICKMYSIFADLEIKNSASQITDAKVKEIYDLCCSYLQKDCFCIHSTNFSALDYLRSIDDDVNLSYMYEDIRGTNNTVTGQPRFAKHTHALITEANLSAAVVMAYRQNGCMIYDGTLVTPNIFNESVKNYCYPQVITNTCSPNLCGRNGIYLTSETSWYDGFYTNGTVNSDGMLVLNNGQYIAFASKFVFIGGMILDVTFKGSINMKSQNPNTSYGLNKTITSSEEFVQQVSRPLVYKNIGGFMITAQSDNTIIKRIDFQFAEL